MSLEGNATAGYVLEGKITGIPRVDDTLTKEGWCADAKVTGDRLAALEGYKDDALEAAEIAVKAAETASKAAEQFDGLVDDVETLKTDVEYLKEHGGGGSGSGTGGGGGSSESDGTNTSAINQRVDEIELRVESVEGDMSTFTQRADRIEMRVEGTENDISTLTQTAEEIELRVIGAEGAVTSLAVSVDEVRSLIKDSDGEVDFSQINQRIDSIEMDVVNSQAEIDDNTTEIGKLQLKSDEFSTKIAEVEGEITTNKNDIEENAAKYSQIKQTVDDISFTVSEPINGGSNRYVTISLTVGGNTHTGVVMIDGNVDVSGQLSAEALYATLGDIARLKVDSLSTSRRIPMYLAGDESDDNYIDIEEQHIALRRAWTDGSEEQARDDFGALLYWEQDIEDADIGSDGYPYVNGARVFITTEETDWPVMVYSYESGDRLRIMFDEDNNYGPRMVWGEGDGSASGKGRGYIEKLGLSFDIYNKGTDGVKRGVFMGNDFTDIVGQRRPTKIAFSGDVCNITLEGGVTEKLTFNRTNGVITSVTDSNGHTCTLEGLE